MTTSSKKIIISILASFVLCINAIAVSDALKIKIISGSTSDETVVRFLPTATPGFDGSFDAYKLFSSSTVNPSIFTTIASSSHLSINALPSFSQQINIELFTLIKVAGVYTIQSIELGTGFPPDVKLVLEDKETNSFYNFRNGTSFPVTMAVNSMTSPSRFCLHVSLPAVINLSNITCSGLNNGSILIIKAGNPDWSFELSDDSLNNVADAANINESFTITNLSAGNYTLYTHSDYSLSDTSQITITEPAAVIADFSSNFDQVYLSSAEITFNNTSINASLFTWDFGDGSLAADSSFTMHEYLSAGNFNVTLTASDSAGCNASITKPIIVLDDLSTALYELDKRDHLNVFQSNGSLQLDLQTSIISEVKIIVCNNLGQIVYDFNGKVSMLTETILIESNGVYIINSRIGNEIQSKKFACTK